jgi:hypothetical protein
VHCRPHHSLLATKKFNKGDECTMLNRLQTFVRSIFRRILDKAGGTSTLEIALVLVTFVIVASLFTYTMLSG